MEPEYEALLKRERAARIEAEAAARTRDEFLAVVSHELRAPLNGIQCWSHIIERHVVESDNAPLLQRAVNGIKTGISQQVRLLENLLDVTRMLSGKLRLVMQPVSMLPLIRTIVEDFAPAAAAKQIRIACDCRLSDEQVEGDPDRIHQVLSNLVSNAIKFTPAGGHVELSAAGCGQHIEITVSDDGAGIAPEFLPHLFDRFSRHDMAAAHCHGGLGLGLFLVRHLVALHGGAVGAHSDGCGMGARFTVNLPMRQPDRQRNIRLTMDGAEPAASPSLSGIGVVLIVDQQEARESLANVLTAVGAQVFTAACAGDVLHHLAAAQPDDMPDILICDIGMPGEDGYAALAKLRAWKIDEETAPLRHVPAIALTAFAERKDRIRALTAGFRMHMAKPVAPDELIVAIAMMTAR
jgi:CheY-like chemotaxis protein/nitrogen-specific signal transduction histidine kinase